MKLTTTRSIAAFVAALLLSITCLTISSLDRKSTRLNSSHNNQSRMPSSA